MKSNIEFVDKGIGKILKLLEEKNILDNTILILTGDNGTAGYGKGKLENEVASRVPFIVYGPGLLKVKGPSDVMVDFSDVLPTLMELAGNKSESPGTLNGHSFAPYLLGQEFTPRPWISTQLNEARWIRTREWLLDGRGHLWYCGKNYDESLFADVTFKKDSVALSKRKELQEIMDKNIPLPDYNEPGMKEAWAKEFMTRAPYEIYKGE